MMGIGSSSGFFSITAPQKWLVFLAIAVARNLFGVVKICSILSFLSF
jgi:hypothetical protein